ncbi:hypothetical protein F5888DRAFT_1952455 [Russula emetica]|nr:hypothetical protein F5888DRAFT_1952455 [Russula emetica]
MPNQHKPCPPLPLIESDIRRFHSQGVSIPKMVLLLKKHYDTDTYGIGRTKLKHYVKELGLTSARSEGHSFETIAEPIAELREMYPTAGANALHVYMRTHFDMHVSRDVIRRYLKQTEPDLVAGRLARRFVRREAGINNFWAMGQHDKWKRFGLYWHGCLDGFTGKILWLVVWWTNANPRFVCAQYLEAVRTFGGAPCVTQSDRGTENFDVACAHTHIRHMLDPSLSGSIQHQWMHGHSNVKPAQMWSRFRRMWAPGFESLLQKGISQQWYDDVNVADRLVFRWLAIPWLQKAADSYVYDHNTTRRRANRRKVLPNEVPDVMFENPEIVNALDFKIIVPDALLEVAERQWAPPTDPVFNLVPPSCNKHISSIYAQLGHPQINFHSFWDVYNKLRDAVDAEFLFHYSRTGAFPEEHTGISEDDLNVAELPLSHLRSCQFGEDGVPAVQIIEEDDDLVVDFTDDEADEIF